MPDTPNPSSSDLPPVLSEIIDFKLGEIAKAKAKLPVADLESMIADSEPPRDFFGALVKPSNPRTRVIAEIKRQSPSAGLIRPEYEQDGFVPELIAQQYSQAGASAISCLTDEKFFGGHLSFMRRIKQSVDLPVIRKDFILDPYQILEARAHSADAVLLIAECLDNPQMIEMLDLAHRLDLSVLLESHSRSNLERVLPLVDSSTHRRVLLGINNRDLTKMETDLAHTAELADLIVRADPNHHGIDRSRLVSESGIKTPQNLADLRTVGVHIVLVGEHLMRQEHPGQALRTLLGDS